ALLGPQLQTGGYGSYEQFWGRFEQVQSHPLSVDAQRMAVRVIVVYSLDDRRPTAELHELILIQNDRGDLLINADHRLGATRVPSDSGGRGRGG
ncbi:MAG TPA: hypothetical protein VFM37_02885, partial [Pseudonocardiaceae bacterium]|nr:hypothetical protein [Pseudonocardiaceae bacterium]